MFCIFSIYYLLLILPIYSVILYECLFGKAPYTSKTIEELLQRIRSAEKICLPPNSRISVECEDLLRRLLEHDPAKRINFSEFFAHPFLDLKTFPSEKVCNMK